LEREHNPPTSSREPTNDELSQGWLFVVQAALAKQASDVRVLDLRNVTSFTDHFVICTGGNTRQIQAIADEILLRLKQAGELAIGTEGYDNAEWILLDYGDYIVHVFSEKARGYYDLERLWRHAKTVSLPEDS
jgi:ribosome-associated protein